MKTTTTKSEQDDNFRLKNAADFLKRSRELENEARAALASAIEQAKRAKEKHEELFAACEARAVARRKSGTIIVNPGY